MNSLRVAPKQCLWATRILNAMPGCHDGSAGALP